jgi:hypothetical protein
MEALKPIVLVRSLKTVGDALVVAYTNRRRLLPVVVGVFLINLVLTELMVNVARPYINLDSMRPFFDIADNSTAPAGAKVVVFSDAGKDDSTSWKLISVLGDAFSMFSTIVATLLFSKACSYNLAGTSLQNNSSFSSFWCVSTFMCSLSLTDLRFICTLYTQIT